MINPAARVQLGAAGLAAPSDWVVRYIHGVSPGGRVLDVACGPGRHFPLALEGGRRVTGIDRDTTAAVARWRNEVRVELLQADLEDGSPFPCPASSFAGVIVTNYLWRPILPAIIGAVASDGLLIYETFMIGQEQFGRPRNPDFLLRPGELLETVCPQLKVIAFEHVRLRSPDRIVQRIVAAGQRHPWPCPGM